MSHASASAIRQCLATGNLTNGYFILNSLQCSHYNPSTLPKSLPGLRVDPLTFSHQALQYGQPVPLRLAYHTLLHGLIKIGLRKKAEKLARDMMQMGITLNSRSMFHVVNGILTTSPNIPGVLESELATRLGLYVQRPDVLKFSKGQTCSRNTIQASRFVEAAKHHRQQRSWQIWGLLIGACLLQAEILAATFFFAAMVKGLQISLERRAALAESSDSSNETAYTTPKAAVPQATCFHNIIRHIDLILSSTSPDPVLRQSALQALVKMAWLLDTRQLPFPEIAPLIRCLARFPNTGDRVWIHGDSGKARKIDAFHYFQQVLGRLVKSPPTGIGARETGIVQPCLDTHSINALLHYTLIHRRNTGLANELMSKCPNWSPDSATYNTLITAGTRLRRPDIVRDATAMLAASQNTQEQDRHSLVVETVQSMDQPSSVRPNTQLQHQLLRNSHDIVACPSQKGSTDIASDKYTTSATLTHLVATSRSDLAISLIFRMIPELLNTTQTVTSPDLWDSKTNYDKILLRCIELGPYFFSVIFNALRKEGELKLMERMWFWARKAERSSWDIQPGGMNAGGTPWCLPIHAYTTVLQAYATEARERSVKQESTHGLQHEKLARQGVRAARQVTGRRMAYLTYKSFFIRGQRIYDHFLTLKDIPPAVAEKIRLPSADARFFNAYLEIILRDPRLPRTPTGHVRSKGAAHWRRHLTAKLKAFAVYGRRPATRHELLVQLKSDMSEAGMEIPLAVKHLVVDHLSPGDFGEMERGGGFLQPRRVSHRFANATKTKGLALRRRSFTQRRQSI